MRVHSLYTSYSFLAPWLPSQDIFYAVNSAITHNDVVNHVLPTSFYHFLSYQRTRTHRRLMLFHVCLAHSDTNKITMRTGYTLCKAKKNQTDEQRSLIMPREIVSSEPTKPSPTLRY